MNLCNDDHDEVCFEGRTCPACAIREDLERKVSDLEDDVKSLENKVSDLESQLEDVE
jgi:hypothetical protein